MYILYIYSIYIYIFIYIYLYIHLGGTFFSRARDMQSSWRSPTDMLLPPSDTCRALETVTL